MADLNNARRAKGAGLRRLGSVILAVALLAGCSGGPAGVAPPDWDPDGMAEAAMELFDKNGDGVLDQQELAAAPGLKAAAEAEGGGADADRDGRLTREEIRERIAYYEQTAIGLTNMPMEFYQGKQPLAGANVELVPEPFLEGVLDSAKGTTRQNGFVVPSVEGEPVSGVRPGMYRIRVTSPSAQVPPKYNENTTLGVEVIPPREGYGSGRPVFELESS